MRKPWSDTFYALLLRPTPTPFHHLAAAPTAAWFSHLASVLVSNMKNPCGIQGNGVRSPSILDAPSWKDVTVTMLRLLRRRGFTASVEDLLFLGPPSREAKTDGYRELDLGPQIVDNLVFLITSRINWGPADPSLAVLEDIRTRRPDRRPSGLLA